MRLIVLIPALIALCVSAQAAEAAAVNDVGPRISDKQFFEMLDLDHPGLSKVKAAVESGDLELAKHEFADYIRHRQKPVFSFDPYSRPKLASRPAGVDTTEADKILQHDLLSGAVRHKFEGEIDWTLNPINYKEWTWQFNRHESWPVLARAYWATGEEKYAKEFVYQMTDWVKKCPVPTDDNGKNSPCWRTIEAGLRMGFSWPESFYRFLSSPSFTDEAIVTMIKSMAEHAQHLMRWPSTANWLTMETNGLMHVGVLFPEFKDAALWRKTATERAYSELDKQVYPDGAQIELSTGYHGAALGNFLEAWQIAHINDYPMPQNYIKKMQGMFEYYMKLAMPDGTTPGLNDADRQNVRATVLRAFSYFPDRKDYEWFGTAGKEGTKPAFTSVAMPWSGHLVMRSGWEPNDLWGFFDAGPFGYGHQHEDALNIALYAYGKYMLVDPGSYSYDGSQWRRYIVSTRAHNTVMVDDLEQHRAGKKNREEYVLSKPMPIKWASDAKIDYAQSVYDDGYGGDNALKVKHTRSVVFVKPEYWVVIDRLEPVDNKSHDYSTMFHLDMSGAKVDPATNAVQTTDTKGANLTIWPMAVPGQTVSVITGQEKPIVQGWVRKAAFGCRPIPTAVFENEQAGPTTMAYVLYPTAEGEKCPIKRVERRTIVGDDGAVGLAVIFEDGHMDLLALCEKAGAPPVTFMPGCKPLHESQLIKPEVKDLSDTPVRHKF